MQRPRVSYLMYCLYTLYSIYAHVHRRAKHLVLCGNFVIFDISKATKQKYTICASTCMQYAIWYSKAEFTCFCFLHWLLTNTFDSTQHQHNQTMYFLVKMYYVLNISTERRVECRSQHYHSTIYNIRGYSVSYRYGFSLTFKYS